jgi:RIMS-binding protein 2
LILILILLIILATTTTAAPVTSPPTSSSSTTTTKRISPGTNPTNIKSNTQSIKKMIAMFDYNPSEHSPNINPDDELSFHSGDIIYVHGNVHDDGFYLGELENGTKGLVPSNFLKEVSSINVDENSMQQNNEQMIMTNENKVKIFSFRNYDNRSFFSIEIIPSSVR